MEYICREYTPTCIHVQFNIRLKMGNFCAYQIFGDSNTLDNSAAKTATCVRLYFDNDAECFICFLSYFLHR